MVSKRALRRGFLRVFLPALFLFSVTAVVLLVRAALRESGTQVAPAFAGERAPAPVAQEPLYYRIRAGDTLDLIAIRFHTTVGRLLELNPGVDPHLLPPGRKLRAR